MTTRTNKRAQMTGRIAAAALCVSVTGYLAVGTAAASKTPAKGSPVNTFTISGAGHGTLHFGHSVTAGCVDIGGSTSVSDLVGPISGFTKNVTYWNLDVIENNRGTFKITGSPIKQPHVVFDPEPLGKTSAKWDFTATTGTVTIAAKTDSISASMRDVAGQTVKISGSWTCKAL